MPSPWRGGLRFARREDPFARPRPRMDLLPEGRAGTRSQDFTAHAHNAWKRGARASNARVHRCGCGRTIRGPSFFKHTRKCPQGTAA